MSHPLGSLRITVLGNSPRLARCGAGGTTCSAALAVSAAVLGHPPPRRSSQCRGLGTQSAHNLPSLSHEEKPLRYASDAGRSTRGQPMNRSGRKPLPGCAGSIWSSSSPRSMDCLDTLTATSKPAESEVRRLSVGEGLRLVATSLSGWASPRHGPARRKRGHQFRMHIAWNSPACQSVRVVHAREVRAHREFEGPRHWQAKHPWRCHNCSDSRSAKPRICAAGAPRSSRMTYRSRIGGAEHRTFAEGQGGWMQARAHIAFLALHLIACGHPTALSSPI